MLKFFYKMRRFSFARGFLLERLSLSSSGFYEQMFVNKRKIVNQQEEERDIHDLQHVDNRN